VPRQPPTAGRAGTVAPGDAEPEAAVLADSKSSTAKLIDAVPKATAASAAASGDQGKQLALRSIAEAPASRRRPRPR